MFNTAKNLAIAIAVGIGLVSGSAAAAVITLTTDDGRGADSFVRGGGATDPVSGTAYRNTNYGSREDAVFKFVPAGSGSGGLNASYDNNFFRMAYFRFDLSGISGTITDASLSLGIRATETGSSIPIVFNTIADGHAQDADPGAGGWAENALTMANSGLLTDPTGLLDPINAAGFPVPVTPGPVVGPVLTWTHANLAPRLNADTNGLVTFVVGGAPLLNPRGGNFWTKENDEGALVPTLTLTVEGQVAVPAPGAIVFLAIGIGCLVSTCRRHKTHTD